MDTGEAFALAAGLILVVRGAIAVVQKEFVSLLTVAAGALLALGAFVANL